MLTDDDFRQQVLATLGWRETEDLIEIWQDNDRVEWSDTAFDVIQEILRNRIGHLPPQDPPILEHAAHAIQQERDAKLSQIVELAQDGDLNGLLRILENDSDPMVCLEAAMALAQLQDDHGLDYLVRALDDRDTQVRSAARQILVELNHPRGNLALESH